MPYQDTEYVLVKLSDGSLVKMEVKDQRDLAEVKRGGFFSFQKVKEGVVSYVEEIKEIWQRAQPDKLTVEFGIEISADTDNTLMAVLVSGKGTGNLNIKLEWQRQPTS